MFFRRKTKTAVWVLAFCDTPDLSTKYGQYYVEFTSFENACRDVLSKANGWGRVIKRVVRDGVYEINGSFIVVEKK